MLSGFARPEEASPVPSTSFSIQDEVALITSAQLASIRTELTSHLKGVAGSAVAFLSRVFEYRLGYVLVAVLSIYLLSDGSRVSIWLRENTPAFAQAPVLLDTVQRIISGYIQGQFLLAVLVGVLVGGGMFVFHVPYVVLLGVLEFVSVLGTLISGATLAAIKGRVAVTSCIKCTVNHCLFWLQSESELSARNGVYRRAPFCTTKTRRDRQRG